MCPDFDLCDACYKTALIMSERGLAEPGEHSSEHAVAPISVAANFQPKESGKLSEVVGNAVQRWFAEASRAAKSGDANQMALLSQMLMEGYGCERDVERAQYWHMRSRQYGARRIDGVYDKIP